MKNLSIVSTSIALALALSACGGGGSSSTPPPTPTPQPTGTIDDQYTHYLKDLTANHILPSYEDFQTQSAVFAQATSTFCLASNTTDAQLDLVKASWLKANVSWQNIQWVKVGPVVDNFVSFRIQNWPDSNNAVERGIADLLATSEKVTVELVAKKQTGAQGLPAAEMLLYPQEASDSLLTSIDKSKRCESLTAISANIAKMANDIYTQWSPTGGNYVKNVMEGTGEFTGKKDAVEELVTNWLEHVERVKDEKILKPVGNAAPGIANLAEHALSDKSLNSIKANINTFGVIYTAGQGHGFDNILIDFLDQQATATSMKEKIDAAQAAITALEGSYKDALNDETKRAALENTIDKIRDVRDTLTGEFVQMLDLSIGFNSNDGD